jgi:hypothetical protein
VAQICDAYRQHAPDLGFLVQDVDHNHFEALPSVLKLSFLALAVRFVDSPFFENCRTSAKDLFKQSAVETFFHEVQDGRISDSTLECIVLLVHCDILGRSSRPQRLFRSSNY